MKRTLRYIWRRFNPKAVYHRVREAWEFERIEAREAKEERM
jgi:hypothetical protein